MKKNTLLILCMLLTILPNLIFGQKNRYAHLLVGTYTKTQHQGIFVYKFDSLTGDLTFQSSTEQIDNPSYLIISKDEKFVYTVNEASGSKSGLVSAFKFDKKKGKLFLLNQKEINAKSPCHLTLTPDEKYLVTANYGSGSISVISISPKGSLNNHVQTIVHTGKSVNKSRQNEPHAHSVGFNKQGTILYSADLGTDQLYAYQYLPFEKEPFVPYKNEVTLITPGYGPRHFTFSPQGDKIYVLGELTGMISVFDYNNNELKQIQDVYLKDVNYKGAQGAAAIHISEDGKFLYASNRADINEIVIFRIEKDGKLIKIDAVNSGGKTPRDFTIDPTGNFLLVAHQNSNDILVFKRNPETGLLTNTPKKIEIDSPVCLKMISL